MLYSSINLLPETVFLLVLEINSDQEIIINMGTITSYYPV